MTGNARNVKQKVKGRPPISDMSDLEILEMVKTESNNSNISYDLNMNAIEKPYVGLLEASGCPLPTNPRYKPYLKQLIIDNLADVHFTRPPDKTKPEQVLSTKRKETQKRYEGPLEKQLKYCTEISQLQYRGNFKRHLTITNHLHYFNLSATTLFKVKGEVHSILSHS